MADPRAPSPLRTLRADLLRGEFDTLAEHIGRLEALEDELTQGTARRSDLAALRDEALAVASLLTAAGSGVRAALRRLRDASAPARTYGVDGRRTVLGGEPEARGTRA